MKSESYNSSWLNRYIASWMQSMPIKEEPIVGWRSWRFNTNTSRLYSWNQNTYMWSPGRFALAEDAGKCVLPPGEVHPSRYSTKKGKCRCGIYALKTKEDVFEELFKFGETLAADEKIAFGTVNLLGRYVAGEKGWRAEKAYPIEIFICDGTPEEARSLASIYHVDASSIPRPVEIKEKPISFNSFHLNFTTRVVLDFNTAVRDVQQTLDMLNRAAAQTFSINDVIGYSFTKSPFGNTIHAELELRASSANFQLTPSLKTNDILITNVTWTAT